MDKETPYQGWPNWHTWNANLWLCNDEPLYKMARSTSSGADLKAFVIAADLKGDGLDVAQVDFDSIWRFINE